MSADTNRDSVSPLGKDILRAGSSWQTRHSAAAREDTGGASRADGRWARAMPAAAALSVRATPIPRPTGRKWARVLGLCISVPSLGLARLAVLPGCAWRGWRRSGLLDPAEPAQQV